MKRIFLSDTYYLEVRGGLVMAGTTADNELLIRVSSNPKLIKYLMDFESEMLGPIIYDRYYTATICSITDRLKAITMRESGK